MTQCIVLFFFFSSRRRHTRLQGDWSSDVCSSDLGMAFTVWDEVAFGPANLGWPREQITRHVDRALARLDIAALRDREPATLSGGELQRVIIAGILAMDPALEFASGQRRGLA